MVTLHEKSPCHKAPVQRFGGRRRRCTACGRTWSIHQRRRGRKPRRIDVRLPELLLRDKESVRKLSRKRHCSISTLYRRARRAFDRCNFSSNQLLLPPDQDLVLIIDGLRFRFDGLPWTLYDVAVKPARECYAWFLDPILVPGSETATTWRYVLDAIPAEVFNRVRALVADGLGGIKAAARERNWVYQRCHYHIWALLRPWFDNGGPGSPNDRIRQAVRDILLTADEEQAARARTTITSHLSNNLCGGNWTLKQLLRDWQAVRAHLYYPRLGIPRTTSAVESMHSLMRTIVDRINTPLAVLRRLGAFIRVRPTIACNGQNHQQN